MEQKGCIVDLEGSMVKTAGNLLRRWHDLGRVEGVSWHTVLSE